MKLVNEYEGCLFVQYAIFMSVCLNSFVMYVVSLPEYVNVARVCFVRGFVGLLGSWVGKGGCIWWGGGIGKELLCRMLWIMFSSFWYSAVCSW